MKNLVILLILIIVSMSFASEKKGTFYDDIHDNVQLMISEFDQIPEDRRENLSELAQFIETRIKEGKKAELIFICTHNSRRSHISQIWAQTAAAYYGIQDVKCYSGGTESTAFNPRAIKAMENAGFRINKVKDGENPHYEVAYAEQSQPILAYSKKYDEEGNPKNDFAAIMTCSHADKNCPIVFGASERISVPYDDPKEFDGTPQESQKYEERVHQIGREMLYAFSLVNR